MSETICPGLAYKPAKDFPEDGVVRTFEPFESDHFAADNLSAILLHSSQCQLLVPYPTRADSLFHDEYLASQCQKVEYRLLNTDMGLRPYNDPLWPVGARSMEQGAFGKGREMRLFHDAVSWKTRTQFLI